MPFDDSEFSHTSPVGRLSTGLSRIAVSDGQAEGHSAGGFKLVQIQRFRYRVGIALAATERDGGNAVSRGPIGVKSAIGHGPMGLAPTARTAASAADTHGSWSASRNAS